MGITRVELNKLTNCIDNVDLIKKIIDAGDDKAFLIMRAIKLNSKIYLINKILDSSNNRIKNINSVIKNQDFLINTNDYEQFLIIVSLLNIREDLMEIACAITINKYILENRSSSELLLILYYISNVPRDKVKYIYKILSNPYINQMRNSCETFIICNTILVCSNDDIPLAISNAISYEIIKNESIEGQIEIINNKISKEYKYDKESHFVTIEEIMNETKSVEDINSLSKRLINNGINYFNLSTQIK